MTDLARLRGLVAETKDRFAVSQELFEGIGPLLTELERYRNAEVLATHSHGDGHREWWSGGTWLYPGESVIVIDTAKDAK